MMRNCYKGKLFIYAFASALIFFGCSVSPEKDNTLFDELSSDETGITFSNTVTQSGENNVLNYPYYFNGGGVAVGDINNDGRMDVYFTGNQVPNRLYLNKGNFEFEDITEKAGVAAPVGWKTGVTMADVNQDGWLDIYVCRSALVDSTQRQNLLFINNGDLTFTEKAKAYGIADDSYSTHASFFDYDRDGDLDLFVLNHSIPQYAGFSRLLGDLKKKKASKFGSKLYRNDEGSYHDVTEQSGLINNVLSFGLGLAVSDVNLDGWPDLYVSNDFNEEDYLYINQKDGTLKNVIKEATGHVSLFSMGSDIADINNDARPDIFTLDMMPETNERIKLSSGDDNYDKYKLLINAGFHHQSMRNMLQLNNGDGTFSEIGQLAGISNTDWSWAALFADFNGDGWKDLFVTNGYEKDYTNMQFLKFTVDEQIKARQTGTSPDVGLILDRMPAIEVGNYLFKNNGDLTFSNATEEWGISRTFKSNGAAYADLDNDGDPDLLINVMNGPAVVYKNGTVEQKKANFITIDLTHEASVSGTKIFCYASGKKQYYEFSPNRGFQSCMYAPLQIGVDQTATADSIRIIWPDDKTKVYRNVSAKNVFVSKYAEAEAKHAYQSTLKPLLTEVKSFDWRHSVGDVNDFKRQFLLPRMYSLSGPRIIKGDVNGDKLEDIYLCAPKGQEGSLFIQTTNGNFEHKKTVAFEVDKDCQDEDAALFDADHDGDLDLYVVSGGYLFNENDKLLQDRLYINDGKGNFIRSKNAVPDERLAGSCVTPLDIDSDGDDDLFVGTRMIPGKYPMETTSMILINDGNANFTKANTFSPSLQSAGMVCAVSAVNLKGDATPELIVAGEWTPIRIFSRQGESWVDESDNWFGRSTNGWWNCLLAEDFDRDGDIDLMAGNYGLNTQFHVSESKPATLVYKDFDNDNEVDHFFNYFIDDQSHPFASRDEALSEVAFLKPRFTDYIQYADATLETMFKKDELVNATQLKADVLRTMYFENKGGRFEAKDLPIEGQFSPVFCMLNADIDNDGDPDVIMMGNESNVRVRIGKTDANKGIVLLNDGKGNFSYLPQYLSGLNVEGDVRSIVNVGEKILFGIIGSDVKTYSLK